MNRALVLIPYRDRLVHLNVLLPYMKRYFPHLQIAVIEQADKGHWNKGLLFNAGYKELAKDYDYIILHDVDFISHPTVDYSYCPVPTLIATECSQFNYQHCYDRFFGGVVGMTKEHYELVNGFSNMFRGWGGEDDHMYNSFIQKGVVPDRRMGNRFENFIHPRLDVLGKDKNDPDYLHNLRLCTSLRNFEEGLSTAQYKVVSSNQFPECIHLKIDTNNI